MYYVCNGEQEEEEEEQEEEEGWNEAEWSTECA